MSVMLGCVAMAFGGLSPEDRAAVRTAATQVRALQQAARAEMYTLIRDGQGFDLGRQPLASAAPCPGSLISIVDRVRMASRVARSPLSGSIIHDDSRHRGWDRWSAVKRSSDGRSFVWWEGRWAEGTVPQLHGAPDDHYVEHISRDMLVRVNVQGTLESLYLERWAAGDTWSCPSWDPCDERTPAQRMPEDATVVRILFESGPTNGHHADWGWRSVLVEQHTAMGREVVAAFREPVSLEDVCDSALPEGLSDNWVYDHVDSWKGMSDVERFVQPDP